MVLVRAKLLGFSLGSTFSTPGDAAKFLASEFRREIPKIFGCRGKQAAGLPNGTGKFI
jgi:hypothetical protein